MLSPPPVVGFLTNPSPDFAPTVTSPTVFPDFVSSGDSSTRGAFDASIGSQVAPPEESLNDLLMQFVQASSHRQDIMDAKLQSALERMSQVEQLVQRVFQGKNFVSPVFHAGILILSLDPTTLAHFGHLAPPHFATNNSTTFAANEVDADIHPGFFLDNGAGAFGEHTGGH